MKNKIVYNNCAYNNVHCQSSRIGYNGRKQENGKDVKCYAKTALACAKILNIRCREAGISIPNPSVGFEAPTAPLPKCGYYNVCPVESRNGYKGEKVENGKRVTSFATTALICAKRLNFRCKEANLSIPNPTVGYEAPRLKSSKYNNVHFQRECSVYRGQKKENGKAAYSCAKTALACAKKLNIKCREAGISIPNPTVGFKFEAPTAPVPKSGYYNVWFIESSDRYRGSKAEDGKTVECYGTTALICARRLNFRCKEANLSIPNPTVGYEWLATTPNSSGYYNVFFETSRNRYKGRKCKNGKSVYCFAKTALACAKTLNFKCRESGIPIPNPGIGFQNYRKRRASFKEQKTKRATRKVAEMEF